MGSRKTRRHEPSPAAALGGLCATSTSSRLALCLLSESSRRRIVYVREWFVFFAPRTAHARVFAPSSLFFVSTNYFEIEGRFFFIRKGQGRGARERGRGGKEAAVVHALWPQDPFSAGDHGAARSRERAWDWRSAVGRHQAGGLEASNV